MVVEVTLKSRFLDGIEFINEDVPDGQTYRVDLDSAVLLQWNSLDYGPQRKLMCVRDVEHGGYLPLELLHVPKSSLS